MYLVTLRFTDRKALALQHMTAHQQWIQSGFDDGVFLLVGSLSEGSGGAVLAHGIEADALRQRVATDPFVEEGVVEAQILAVTPGRVDPRLQFLLEDA